MYYTSCYTIYKGTNSFGIYNKKSQISFNKKALHKLIAVDV